MEIDFGSVSKYMDLRRPSEGIGTSRLEPDTPEFVSGIRNGKTDGMPLMIKIANTDARGSDYSAYEFTPRPGHADLPAYVKGSDYLGGGIFSGRMTAAIVAGGSIARQFVSEHGISTASFSKSIGDVTDVEERSYEEALESEKYVTRSCTEELDVKMRGAIEDTAGSEDSVGGVVECITVGLPVGFGGLWFEALDSELAHAVLSVPGCKGIEFGKGFGMAGMRGSESNDQYYFDNGIKTSSNNMGGIVGGMSDGAPLVFRAVFKPTPSIDRLQKTVDMRTMEEVKIRVRGRHDPCIVPRAAVAVESVTALVIADQIARGL